MRLATGLPWVALSVCAACDGGSHAASSTGGDTGGASTGATTSGASSSSSASGSGGGLPTDCLDPTRSRPESIPAGWVAWTCWQGCDFWIAPEPELQAVPPAWTSCEVESGVASCLREATDWDDGVGQPLGPYPKFDQAADGSHALLTTRVAVDGEASPTSYAEWLLSPLDGPVTFAMRQPRPSADLRCNAFPEHVREGVAAFLLQGDGGSELAQDSDTDGVLVVTSPDPVPRLRHRDTAPGQHNWSAGAEWIDQHDVGIDYLLRTGGDDAPTLLHAASQDPEGLGITGKVLMNGPNALYQVGNYGAFGIMAFDATGSHPLLRKVGDPSQGYGNIGTDGIDLVWSYGEGRPPGEPIYPTISIYTSPYATTTQGLVPRRLRSDQGKLFGLEEGQFVVGCGFAARMLSTGKDVEVVRLVDGAGWTLVGNAGWKYSHPLGLTCDEVVLSVAVPAPQFFAIARIRLDALGDPTPAD